jgi:hypothetical protein
MKIWKTELQMSPRTSVLLPRAARVLCVQTQNERPCVWFEFDEERYGVDEITFFIATTGSQFNMPLEAKYLGSFQLSGGTFVGHVYYI